MAITAFQPMGNTCLVSATSATTVATQVCTGSQQGMHIVNASTATLPVYVAAGSSTVQAACPTTTTPAVGLMIPAQGYVNLTVRAGAWLSAATSGGSASVFATPGFYGQ